MSSLIRTHNHNNYNVLNQFSEVNSVLLYKGIPLNSDSSIIKLSTNKNNALKLYSNGYYVEQFLISKQVNNALVKYSDGYYVPKIPLNTATTEYVDNVLNNINNDLLEQNKVFNERYNLITEKIQQISSNTTKHKTHEYHGNNLNIQSVIDVSTLYNLTSDVILNLEFMIKNNSDTDILNLKILENEIETLNITLSQQEVQKYKLSNIPNIEIFIKGNYNLFLYVNYV